MSIALYRLHFYRQCLARGLYKLLPIYILLILLQAMLASSVRAEERDGFWVKDANVVLKGGIYYLDAKVKFNFDRSNIEAIHHGVPITIEVQMKVLRERQYVWGEEVARLSQKYQIRYHALSERYLVFNINSGQQLSFQSWDEAMLVLGDQQGIPLLDKSLLRPGSNYIVRVRAILDIEALPLPLRPLAYLSPLWSMASDWYSCPLE